MGLTVLSDADIEQLLNGLSKSELSNIIKDLGGALTTYSLGDEQQHQPHRAVVSRDGQTSLFMPSTTKDMIGTKMVGVAPPRKTTGDAKIAPGLKSVLTLCDASGEALGILNAAELTAFRTSLGIMLLYQFRRHTENIVVFGAGKQALWHVRLALLLHGDKIKKITIVNRSQERSKQLIQTVEKAGQPTSMIEIFDDAQSNRDEALKSLVSESDAIFCTTPSTSSLFPASYLTSDHARAKSRFISMIGSYRLDMQEIDPDFLKLVVDAKSQLSSQVHGGVVAVDTKAGCLQEAGELVKAGIDEKTMREVGEILKAKEASDEKALTTWLEEGLVVFKSVGIGIMDIAVGSSLLSLAKEKGVGTVLPVF